MVLRTVYPDIQDEVATERSPWQILFLSLSLELFRQIPDGKKQIDNRSNFESPGPFPMPNVVTQGTRPCREQGREWTGNYRSDAGREDDFPMKSHCRT